MVNLFVKPPTDVSKDPQTSFVMSLQRPWTFINSQRRWVVGEHGCKNTQKESMATKNIGTSIYDGVLQISTFVFSQTQNLSSMRDLLCYTIQPEHSSTIPDLVYECYRFVVSLCSKLFQQGLIQAVLMKDMLMATQKTLNQYDIDLICIYNGS